MIEYVLYFLAGVLIDMLCTLDAQAVIDRKPYHSGVYSFCITMVSILVISGIVLSNERVWLVVSYALGGALGSAVTVARKRNGG